MTNQQKTSHNYTQLSPEEVLEKTITALKKKNFLPIKVSTKSEALDKIKELIPAGASVMNGSSTTLNQIGYTSYLKSGKHPWIDLHAQVNAENDEVKRAALRKQSVLSDYYLGSVHALTQSGDMVITSNSGSQLPHLAFTSKNIILVVSTKKIVSDLDEAMKRIEEHVVPLEDERMMTAMKAHTQLNKILILKGDPEFLGRKIYIILVEEDLGF